MAMHRTVLTYEDYAALPDDGRRYEIHDGELSVTPAPGTNHQRVSRNLYDILGAYVKTRDSAKSSTRRSMSSWRTRRSCSPT